MPEDKYILRTIVSCMLCLSIQVVPPIIHKEVPRYLLKYLVLLAGTWVIYNLIRYVRFSIRGY